MANEKTGIKPRILFLVPYPIGKAPSQRFRVEALLPLLDDRGTLYHVSTFFDGDWNGYTGNSGKRIAGVLKGLARRLVTMFLIAPRFTHVFVHREASPIGPPIFEWYLSKILRKKLIFDFDDAIWMSDIENMSPLFKWLKCFWKISSICRMSYQISAGNSYLSAFAKQHAGPLIQVKVIPTVVDAEFRYCNVKIHQVEGTPVLGWTGSKTTIKFLDPLIPLIKSLQSSLPFCFMVIADEDPGYDLENYKFVSWNPGTEISDLLKIDIGIMPLPDEEWSKGKCGFKLIQYQALGIPAVASNVGVNSQIIQHTQSGFLANSGEEWYKYLSQLIGDSNLRTRMGSKGRKNIHEAYSINSIQENFLGLFD